MKILAQVTDDMQPVYHVAQGISQSALIKAIQSVLMLAIYVFYLKIYRRFCLVNIVC